MLICDDDAANIRQYYRLLGLTATKLNCDVAQLNAADDITAAMGKHRLLALAQNTSLILDLVDAILGKNLSALFALMTDGNLDENDKLKTGHELILELRRRIPDLEAIMVTGNPEGFSALGAQYGYRVIGKPADPQELRNYIISFFSSG